MSSHALQCSYIAEKHYIKQKYLKYKAIWRTVIVTLYTIWRKQPRWHISSSFFLAFAFGNDEDEWLFDMRSLVYEATRPQKSFVRHFIRATTDRCNIAV